MIRRFVGEAGRGQLTFLPDRLDDFIDESKPTTQRWRTSDSGDKALRASALSAFVDVMYEVRLVRLDAGKVHLRTTFYAI